MLRYHNFPTDAALVAAVAEWDARFARLQAEAQRRYQAQQR